MKRTLIIKRNDNENIIKQMYQANFTADNDIAEDFTEIIDKIIIDIYLKENVFSSDKYLNLSNEEKKEFVLNKRKEIIDKMSQSKFVLEDYLNSEETSFKMTACVKCNCLGIHDKEYDKWKKDNQEGLYCEICKQEQDDFRKIL